MDPVPTHLALCQLPPDFHRPLPSLTRCPNLFLYSQLDLLLLSLASRMSLLVP